MLSWINASLNRTISSLLVILLSFILLVIVYSICTLKIIESEMHEVAEIDIPLNEVMGQAEIIQLRQHLFFEKIRLKGIVSKVKMDPSEELSQQNNELTTLFNRATHILNTSLKKSQVRFEVHEHQQLLSDIEQFYRLSNDFEDALIPVLNQATVKPEEWQHIENSASGLDAVISSVLQQINTMTLETARYTEKHEDEFMLVNVSLGFCAIVIGILLTLYIIQVVRLRIGRIQQEIAILNHSLDSGEPLPPSGLTHSIHKDELADLESDLKLMMQRLSQEITSRREIEIQLLALATQDKLTGAFNRHKWDDQIETEMDLARRGGVFSIILLDIDHFKTINDAYGHHTGDKVLKVLVDTLSKRIRKMDMIFRMGGEEFVILSRQQSPEGAYALAEALRTICANIKSEGLPAFTVSIGVTNYQPADNDESVLQRADKALYQAKTRGRNQVQQL